MTAAGLVRLLEAERALEAQAARDPEAKTAIAHIAAWRDRFGDALEALIEGRPAPSLENADAINAREHPSHLSASWEQVREAWAGSFDRLLGLSRRLSDQDLGRPPGWFTAPTLLDAVLRNSVTHPASHLIELYRNGGTVEALGRQVLPRLRLLEELGAPAPAVARAQLGVALHQSLAGNADEAREHLEAALRLDPELAAQARVEPALAGLLRLAP